MKKLLLSFLLICMAKVSSQAQDIESLMDDAFKEEAQPVLATFKSSRVINLHSPELVAPGNLEFRISHRFGPFNGGSYELWGLDQATMRLGLDFGISKRLTVGVGRSTYQKTYDGFLKYSIMHQNTFNTMPVSMVLMSSMSINSLHFSDPTRDNFFSSRLVFVNELVVARKFSEKLSLEVVPTWVHYNLVSSNADQNDIPIIGLGGRFKLSKRVSLNAEYAYRVFLKNSPSNLTNYYNSFSVGVDIDTGGHVFQFHLTNSLPMVEKGFLTETNDSWTNGGIHLGFNITREFVLRNNKP